MPNITNNEYEGLLRDRERLLRLQERNELQPFVNELIHSLGTLLAHMPMRDWPNLAKHAFAYAKNKHPHAAALYEKHLPK